MIENFKNQETFNFEKTNFVGYDTLITTGTVLGLFDANNQPVEVLKDKGYFCVNQTPFYALSGGQASDQGVIKIGENTFKVLDIRKDLVNGYYIHEIDLAGHELKVNDQVELEVNKEWRKYSSINHSSLHIMWQTILKKLGFYLDEVGSKLDKYKYQLQFKPHNLLTEQLVLDVTNEFNEKIIPADIKVNIFYLSQQEAAEKNYLYEFTKVASNELVRMVEFPNVVIEPCSGTHMNSTKEAQQTWFLNYDQNSKRILIEMTSNPNYAKKYFTEKLIQRFEEIQYLINKGKKQGLVLDFTNLLVQAEMLLTEWNYLSIKKMNDIYSEITLIINKNLKEQEREIMNQLRELEFQFIQKDNFLIAITENDLYTNKIMLSKVASYSNNEPNKIIVFLNKQSSGSNLILIKNRDYDFNLKQLLPTIFETTSFKGGGNDSMIQMVSSNSEDVEKFLKILE